MKASAVIDSFISWLRGLLRSGEGETQQPTAPSVEPSRAESSSGAAPPVEPRAESSSGAAPPVEPRAESSSGAAPPVEPPPRRSPRDEALAYLSRVRAKASKLAEDFNEGTINRAQFRNLYAHYQREIQSVEAMVEAAPASDQWKGVMTEGQSLVIRRQHSARAQGYAIFENDSGMPVSTLGRFELDPALVVPMLSSYRAAAKEVFGAGMRSTEIEDGRWLCYVPGEFTTMLAIFGAEPARRQVQFLEQLHRDFEQANRRRLANPPLDPSSLLFPHEYYLGQWRT